MEAFWDALWGANTLSLLADQPHPCKALRTFLLEKKPKSRDEFKVLCPELLGNSLLPACLCSETDKLRGKGKKGPN